MKVIVENLETCNLPLTRIPTAYSTCMSHKYGAPCVSQGEMGRNLRNTSRS